MIVAVKLLACNDNIIPLCGIDFDCSYVSSDTIK